MWNSRRQLTPFVTKPAFSRFSQILTTISGSQFWENREKAGFVTNGGELPTADVEPLNKISEK